MAPIFNPEDNSSSAAALAAALVNAIASLNVNFPTFRKTYPQPYSQRVGNELVQIIGPTEKEQPRRPTVLNKGPGEVRLYFGDAPPIIIEPATALELDSPWILYPGESYNDPRDGGYGVWAVSPTNATVVVGIQYPGNFEDADTGDTDSMEIPLGIDLLCGTGANFNKNFPINFWPTQNLKNLINSDQDVTGFKLFRFNSFVPSQEYEFNLVVGGNINFDTSRTEPIEVSLFDEKQLYSAAVALITDDWGDLEYNIPSDLVGWIKKGSFVTTLPLIGGSFKITPNSSRKYGHFTVFTQNDGPQGAVVNQYDLETNTFYLVGY